MGVKKIVKTTYLGTEELEGFSFVFEPVEGSVQIEKVKKQEKDGPAFVARYITPDDCNESPDDWGDDNLFLVGYHRNFWVEGPRIFYKLPEGQKRDPQDEGHLLVTEDNAKALWRKSKKESEANGYEWPEELAKKYHTFGLEAYIHSGVSLALSYEGNFPDRRWDVSQLGLVFVAKEEWKTRKKARKAAEGLIETWNQYLSGDVYTIVREDYDQEKNQIKYDCVGGYYGREYALKAVKTEV